MKKFVLYEPGDRSVGIYGLDIGTITLTDEFIESYPMADEEILQE